MERRARDRARSVGGDLLWANIGGIWPGHWGFTPSLLQEVVWEYTVNDKKFFDFTLPV